MSKFIGRLLVVLAFCWAGSASAALMPPVITLNGQEWLQPVDFINHSWNDIIGICNPITGDCSGTLDNVSLDDYTWANVNDVNALFNESIGSAALTGPASSYTDVPGSFTPAFFNDFDLTATISGTRFDVNGWTRDIGASGIGAYTGIISTTIMNDYAFTRQRQLGFPSERIGVWFYRAVPTTATLPLLGLGLVAIAFSRRKRTPGNTPAGISSWQTAQ